MEMNRWLKESNMRHSIGPRTITQPLKMYSLADKVWAEWELQNWQTVESNTFKSTFFCKQKEKIARRFLIKNLIANCLSSTWVAISNSNPFSFPPNHPHFKNILNDSPFFLIFEVRLFLHEEHRSTPWLNSNIRILKFTWAICWVKYLFVKVCHYLNETAVFQFYHSFSIIMAFHDFVFNEFGINSAQ